MSGNKVLEIDSEENIYGSASFNQKPLYLFKIDVKNKRFDWQLEVT